MTRGRAGQISDDDRRHMRAAIALAERGRGTTRPNPVVGAVIVHREKVLARGYHRRPGAPHAEVDALARVGGRAPGATLYVTLEPCCHRGRTGPCTEAVLASGVARVVVGCRDENPLVDGKGITRLRRAGVRVDVGCLEDECRAQNRGFFSWIRDGRPWVTLKVAATLDGFIAAPEQTPGHIHWITGEPARAVAHELRAANDAVLVGAGTVAADDPRLTVRIPGAKRPPPLRVILDGRLRTPPRARLFREEGPGPLVIGAAPARKDPAVARRVLALQRAGAEVALLPARGGILPVPEVLRALAGRGIQSLLVEGGSGVLDAFVAARAVDEVAFFFAPRLAGGGVPIVKGTRPDWRHPLTLGPLAVRTVGADLLVTAQVAQSRARR